MIVRLSYAEIQLAWFVAGQRATNGQKLRDCGKSKHRYGLKPLSWKEEVNGALGELAASKGLNLWWCDPIARKEDVGGMVDVRAVDKRDRRLIIHKEDADERPFVLADVSDLPSVKLAGWLFAGECKRAEWWQDPTGEDRPAYFVGRVELRDAELLRQRCHEEFLDEPFVEAA